MLKPLTVWVTTNWKNLKEMGIPDHLTCLLRNLYAGQEATVKTRHGTTDWSQTGNRACQGCVLSPCLFKFYAEYIMWNARLDEAQAGIKIARRNINNLRYAGWDGWMALLTRWTWVWVNSGSWWWTGRPGVLRFMGSQRVRHDWVTELKEESEKPDLKLNIQKTKIMASIPTTSWQIDGEAMETVTGLIFLGSKITADGDCSHEIKRHLLLGRKAMTNLNSMLKIRLLCQQRSI